MHRRAMATPVRIIGSFVSPYVRKVLACLNLKGIAYEIDPITPFFGNEEYERLSPLRRIPVLIDGDFAVSDSSVVCAYLDEAYPERPLLPSDPKDRARARWFEEYADTRLGDVFIWGLFYQKVVGPMVWNDPTDEERVARTLAEDIPHALDYLETQLPEAGFLFGDIGVADISIASFFLATVRIATNSPDSRSTGSITSAGANPVARISLSQYRVSLASFSATVNAALVSARLWAPFASSRLAPIEVPDRRSCRVMS